MPYQPKVAKLFVQPPLWLGPGFWYSVKVSSMKWTGKDTSYDFHYCGKWWHGRPQVRTLRYEDPSPQIQTMEGYSHCLLTQLSGSLGSSLLLVEEDCLSESYSE